MNEKWKDIPKYEGIYQASTGGEIKRLAGYIKRDHPIIGTHKMFVHENVLKPGTSGQGYAGVTLSKNGRHKTCYVHRLICLTFIGDCPPDCEVMHLDGTRKNNRLSNLRYGSRSCNHAFKKEHGTDTSHENHPMAKLTYYDVMLMRMIRHFEGLSIYKLAQKFDVSPMTVQRAVTKRSWR